MNFARLKNITFITGLTGIFAAGLFFILYTDLVLCNNSTYLFLSIICAFASGIAFIFSEQFKGRLPVFYLLKALTILFGIGFIVVIFLYQKVYLVSASTKISELSDTFKVIVNAKKYKVDELIGYRDFVSVFSRVIGYVGLAAASANLVLNIVDVPEE